MADVAGDLLSAFRRATRPTGGARRAGVLVAAVLALVLAGCGGAPGTRPAADAPPLAFTATTLTGDRLDVATLGGTPVALWFWAPWCTICRAEAPDVATVAAQYQGRVRLIGVPGRGDVPAMQAFVAETGTGGFTHLVDADGALWSRFGVVAQPTFVFVDRSGRTSTVTGSLDADGLRRALDKLV